MRLMGRGGNRDWALETCCRIKGGEGAQMVMSQIILQRNPNSPQRSPISNFQSNPSTRRLTDRDKRRISSTRGVTHLGISSFVISLVPRSKYAPHYFLFPFPQPLIRKTSSISVDPVGGLYHTHPLAHASHPMHIRCFCSSGIGGTGAGAELRLR